jgi:hypothetical protein
MLNRLELSREGPSRYHKIAFDGAAIEELPVHLPRLPPKGPAPVFADAALLEQRKQFVLRAANSAHAAVGLFRGRAWSPRREPAAGSANQ